VPLRPHRLKGTRPFMGIIAHRFADGADSERTSARRGGSGDDRGKVALLCGLPDPAPGREASGLVAREAVALACGLVSGLEVLQVHPACPACLTMVPVVERLAADVDGRPVVGTVDVTRPQALLASP
jgi:hypothetical protein